MHERLTRDKLAGFQKRNPVNIVANNFPLARQTAGDAYVALCETIAASGKTVFQTKLNAVILPATA